MKLFASIVAALFLLGCATAKISEADRDGSSFEKAVIIKGVKDTETGIAVENAWIREHFQGARKTMQSLNTKGRRQYDIITIAIPGGGTQDVYFDITSFFGK